MGSRERQGLRRMRPSLVVFFASRAICNTSAFSIVAPSVVVVVGVDVVKETGGVHPGVGGRKLFISRHGSETL